MFKELNQELVEVKEKVRLKKKYEEHLDRAITYLKEEQAKQIKLKNQLLKEKEDVAKLERFSVTNIFYTLIGQKLEKLDKEQQEVMAVKLKYNECLDTIKDIENEKAVLKEKLQHVAHADTLYQDIIRKKEALIYRSNNEWSEELYRLSDKEGDLLNELSEYEEAIDAGERALQKLNVALKTLDSAKGWSTFDMFGGGMISTAIKHDKIQQAEKKIHDAQKHLRIFQEELLDIKNHFQANLSVGGFLTFADYFFDGFIFDWAVHGKINDSYESTVKIKEKVLETVKSLRMKKEMLDNELHTTIEKRKELLESL